MAVARERAGEPGLALHHVDRPQRAVRPAGERAAQPVGQSAAEPLGDDHQVQPVALAQVEQLVEAGGVRGERLLQQDAPVAEAAQGVQGGDPFGRRGAQVDHGLRRVGQPGRLREAGGTQVGGGVGSAVRVDGEHRGGGEQVGGVGGGAQAAQHREMESGARPSHSDQ